MAKSAPFGVFARLALAVSVSVAFAGRAAHTAPGPVQLTDLGTLGGDYSSPRALNDTGQVVGQSRNSAGAVHAFSWTAAGGMIDLGTLGGVAPPYAVTSEALAVNNPGQVVGASLTATGAIHAFSWTAAGGLIDLGTLGGTFSSPFAVNALGQVAGSSSNASGQFHSFFWTAATGMIDAGSFVGWALTDDGRVLGGSVPLNSVGSPTTHVFSWTAAGGPTDLGALGGFGGAYTIPMAVTPAGQVVGYSTTSAGDEHAFTWTPANGIVDLGTLGGRRSFANAVNVSGQVVGTSHLSGDGLVTPEIYHAFSWTRSGGMIDLGTLGGPASQLQTVVSSALAVNARGHVTGFSLLADNTTSHAFFWRPATGLIDLGALGGSSSARAINVRDEITGESQTGGGGPIHAVLWRVAPSPVDIISNLIDAAASANFQEGSQLLRNALRLARNGDSQPVCSQLGAFINQVQAQTGKKLTPSQANTLVVMATDARAALGCR